MSLGLIALALGATGSGGLAQAQTATITALTGQSCAGTRAGSNLICTANDFSSTLTFDQPSATALASCVAGSTISIDVIASITSNSPVRYDGAYFLGEVGNSPSADDSTKSCSLGVFPTTPSPFLNQDSDACGDYAANSSSTLRINGVSLKCNPASGTNQLAIPYTLVFNNQTGSPACTAANVTAGTTAKCVQNTVATVTGVSVNGYITLTKQTNPDGQSQSFSFTTSASPSATVSPSNFNLVDNGTQTVQVPLDTTGGTRTLTLTERATTGWDATASISCTTPSGGSAASYVTVNNAARTISAQLTPANFGAVCTITNTKLPTVTLTKVSQGGTGAVDFSGSNGFGTQTITTATPGTGVSGATRILSTASTATTITETIPAGYRLTGVSCTGLGSGAATTNLPAGTVTFNAAATAPGNDIACTFTNVKLPTITVTKVSNGLTGAFGFSGGNGFGTQTITTTVSGAGVAGSTRTLTAAATATTLTETLSASFVMASASCSGLGAGGSATVDTATGSIAFDAAATAAGSDITCTVVNDVAAPQLTIVKTADTAGPAAVGTMITYSYRVTNAGNVTINGVTVTDAHNGYGNAPVPAGEVLTSDTGTAGDSTDAAGNGSWDQLAPGDVITFTATYTVVQQDVDLLQ